MGKLNTYLFTRIDNSALIVFRVFFGFLITCEAWGALATGWVRRILVRPDFTFNFIGFDFLQTFPGPGPQMYGWFAIMGVFGVMIMFGFKYRVAIIGYAIMWSTVYFMQKTAYNNHYYLLMLLLWIMSILPAHRTFSLDARFRESIRDNTMPRWVTLFIILQLWIVYSYGSIAKIYPDWLDATVPQILMKGRADYAIVGDLLQERWVHWVISYVGILFDGLIIPLLLWKRTRKWAFFISIFFHLFNSVVFQIGIFPYMSLAFTVFFFRPEVIRAFFFKNYPFKRFLQFLIKRTPQKLKDKIVLADNYLESKWKTSYYSKGVSSQKEAIVSKKEMILPKYNNALLSIVTVYFIVQIALPLRQHFISDNVLWTEEGHRLSWRMMLRSKGGTVSFTMEDKETGKKRSLKYKDYLTKNQQRNIRSKPDIIWQFAQHVKREQAALGKDVAIYAKCRVRVNGRKSKSLIDPEVDLTAVSWDWFEHNSWVLPSEEYLDEKSPSVAKYARLKDREAKKKRNKGKDKEGKKGTKKK